MMLSKVCKLLTLTLVEIDSASSNVAALSLYLLAFFLI